MCLLTTHNTIFAKFISQIIILRTQLSEYAIKKVKVVDAVEITSPAVNEFCMSMEIVVEHPVPHIYTQNGMVESLIKQF